MLLHLCFKVAELEFTRPTTLTSVERTPATFHTRKIRVKRGSESGADFLRQVSANIFFLSCNGYRFY